MKNYKIILRKFSSNNYNDNEIIDSCKQYTMWSWSAQKSVDPIVMAKANGIYFWDGNGKRYIDLNSQLMCVNIGHQHPVVIKAIKDQCDELVYAGPNMATKVRAEFGPLLSKHTPNNLNKFFFTLGGSEANENAIKLAKFHTNRYKIISRYRSYHGGTHGSIMLTGDPRRWPNEIGSPMGGIIRAFDPYKYRSILYKDGMSDEEFSQLCLKQLEETILYENPDSIAAMILETVTGTNGLIPPPTGYLPGLRALLSKYGILMICDEVMCGLGRTGQWFACNHWNVIPDIITMAKGITSAYMPLGVVALSSDIAKSFDEKVFSGGLTYNGHPLALAAANATIKVMENENIVSNSDVIGLYLNNKLNELKDKHISVGDVRSIGLFGALELVKNRKTKEPFSNYAIKDSTLNRLMKYLRDHGIFAFSAGTLLFINPPLVINKDQLDEAINIVDKALDNVDKDTYQ